MAKETEEKKADGLDDFLKELESEDEGPLTVVEGKQGVSVRWTDETDSKWEKDNTQFFGTKITGTYKEKRDGVGANSATIYTVESKAHGLLSLWDSIVLADKMKDIPLGSYVEIEFLGKVKPKTGLGKPYATFKVAFRPAALKTA